MPLTVPGTVAILEDDPARVAAFRTCLAEVLPAYGVVTFDRSDAMIGWLDVHLPEAALISLDHDLPVPSPGDDDPGCGRDVADHLAGRPAVCPVVVHSSNNTCAAGMMRVLREAGWAPVRVYPSADAAAWVAANWAPVLRRWLAAGLIFTSPARTPPVTPAVSPPAPCR